MMTTKTATTGKQQRIDPLLSIDTSINSMGVAIFNSKRVLVHCELLRPSVKNGTYIEKSISLTQKVCGLVEMHRIRNLVVEIPEYWGPAGYIARESGSLFKMAFLCGMINAIPYLRTFDYPLDTHFIVPSKWKGQMPKHVCRTRLKKHYGKRIGELDHNVVDAIGIGHWYIYGKL